jgi:DNA-binding NtrC family response regulator
MDRGAEPTRAIIVADDQPEGLAVLHAVMRNITHDCDIITATNPSDVLTQLGQRLVPLIITNLPLSPTVELQLDTSIHMQSPQTRILHITSAAVARLHPTSALAPNASILTKPICLDDFKHIVEEALASS